MKTILSRRCTRTLRPCGRRGEKADPVGRGSASTRSRPEADVYTDDQKTGTSSPDDELAGPEGGETRGRETEGRRLTFSAVRVFMETNSPRLQAHDHGDKFKGKLNRSSGARSRSSTSREAGEEDSTVGGLEVGRWRQEATRAMRTLVTAPWENEGSRVDSGETSPNNGCS